MRPAIRAAALLFFTALSSGCGSESAPAPKPTPEAGPPSFHVDGGFLRDPEGRALLLRGMNLAGAHKAAPYFGFHQLPDYERVRDPWGMNAIRFLITWAAVEPKEGVYDDAYLDALARRMDWAKEAGLLVILDMHQDVYGEGFASGGGDGAPLWTCDASHYASFVPNTSQWFLNYLSPDVTACYDHFWQTRSLHDHYAEAWRRVAERLADYDDVVVGFDPMNEPYWGSHSIVSYEADILQPLYEDVIAAVRSERPRWIAFAEPGSSRNLGIPTSLVPFKATDVVYSPHSYDRDAESGKGFDPTHRDAVMMNASLLAAEAKALGAGLWIGEYGGNPDNPGIVDYMDAEYAAFGAEACGTTYWAYDEGGGYSVLDADGKEREPLVGALVRPWPERVAGDPESYAFDAMTSTFTLHYKPDGSITAPTVISVPDRVYPGGYQVDCGGCEIEKAPGALRIKSPPKGDHATVTISPGAP